MAVVAKFRRKGVSLHGIRTARLFASEHFEADYPFAQLQFQRAGRELYLGLPGPQQDEVLVAASNGGQQAWESLLPDFDYDDDIVTRWYPRGRNCPIVVDPQFAFGQPSIKSIPTRVIRGRFLAGESAREAAQDLNISVAEVEAAWHFENLAA